MADQKIQYTEEMVGAGHGTKSDTLNRLALVEHNNDGTHKGLGAGLTLLATASAAADSTIDFDSSIDSTFDEYLFTINEIDPSVDARLQLRNSTDGGSTYDSGASDYAYASNGRTDAGTTNDHASGAAASIDLVGAAQAEASAGLTISGWVILHRPASAVGYTTISFHITYFDASGQICNAIGSGVRLSAADVDAVRFLVNGGNMTTGKFAMYGRRIT